MRKLNPVNNEWLKFHGVCSESKKSLIFLSQKDNLPLVKKHCYRKSVSFYMFPKGFGIEKKRLT